MGKRDDYDYDDDSGVRPKPLRVLLVEDNEDDAALVVRSLRKYSDQASVVRVDNEAALRGALADGSFDIVLSDWNLPTFDALKALAVVREVCGDLPFVIVSGAVGEDAAVAAMRAGASDYVLKDRLGRLVPVVEREVREHHVRRARVEAEQAIEARDTEIHQRLRGEALLGDVGLALTEGTSLRDTLTRCVRALVTHVDAALARVWLVDAKKATLELVASAGLYERLDVPHHSIPVGTVAVGTVASTRRPHVSDDFANDPLCGDPAIIRQERIVGFAGYPLMVRGELLGVVAIFGRNPFGTLTLKPLHNIASAIALGVRQKMEEEAKLEVEAQLRHSQKMEAVGRLAGGIAHDFNNLLSVITNYAQFIEEEAPAEGTIRGDAHEVVAAAQRAAALTRQLLLFSRRQARESKIIVLDTLVGDMEKMLQRLVGEDVKVTVKCEAGAAHVRVDPGGIEQVLMNLVVNARDAMPKGGDVRICTGITSLDVTRASELGVRPGAHAVFSVSDTGTGIDAETRLRIFEPYFTTKDVSKGTGLGLSMVRGIVQEAGGTVTLDTTVGRGSTFSVYLPRVVEEAPAQVTEPVAARPATSATILLAEDDALVRSTARRLLERKGYRVLEAESGEAAYALASGDHVSFDLVLTDVVMPGMSGPDLARRLREQRPALRVLLMSGYSEDNLVERGAPLDTTGYLRKPFTIESLTTSVRQALE